MIQHRKKIDVTLTFWFCFLCLLISGCASNTNDTLVVSSMSVKEYQKIQKQTSATDQEILEEVSEMSRVPGNSVFTSETGIPEYIVGRGDLLELTSWQGTTSEKFEATVRPDGTISYSFLDDVQVAGLTSRQIDQKLTELLSKYIKKVRIDVTVLKYESKSVSLFGEINILQTGKSGPGKYSLTGKTTVLDVIVAAGGMTKDSDLKKVELVRQGKRYTLNLYDAMFRGDMVQNVIVDHGDVVTVPELPTLGERVYVFGEVNKKGIYPHDETQDLLAAIGRAGGTTRVAFDEDVKIIRGYGIGEPIVLSANLDAILKRGDITQNIHLIDGDVVYVPRTMIGDINEFIKNTTPLLDYLLWPSKFDDAYGDSTVIRSY